MKYSIIALAALSQINNVAAYPAIPDVLANSALEERQQQKGGFQEHTPGFNPKKQRVSVEGKHKFVPPDFDAGDVRGPCPGLNAMANHGYLPHTGVGNHLDFITGTYEVFGMGADLSGFLTVFGAIQDGDGLRWSIGGPSKHLPGLPPLLGVPQGISGSHNRYEADVSPGRGDLYKVGNDFELQMDEFQELYDLGQSRGDEYSLKTLIDHRVNRFQNSIETNPFFFNGPFTGVLVAPAAFSFIYRFMSNKSEEHPNGLLKGDVLKSFFGVHTNDDGKLVKKGGFERIPYNWYKRAAGDAYTIARLNLDTVTAALEHPQFLDVGGNLGKVNSFQGIDTKDLTGGVLNNADLLKGNNLACFAMEFAVQGAPDVIRCSGVLADLEGAMSKLTTQLAASTAELECPNLVTPNNKQFDKFPGFKKLDCTTGNYPPA